MKKQLSMLADCWQRLGEIRQTFFWIILVVIIIFRNEKLIGCQ